MAVRSQHAGGPPAVLIATPLGALLRITANDGAVVGASFTPSGRRQSARITHPVLREAAAEVRAYFTKRLRRFSVPLQFDGTPLQRDAWNLVASLRFGDVVSYADVARAIGRPLAHRGVAAAMRASPIDFFIPAHRVVGADGKPRGCSPRSIRARLLAFEAKA